MNPREPVINAATIASTVTALVSIAVTLGFISAEDGDRLSNSAGVLLAAIVTFVGIVAHIVAALKARAKVTPIASPAPPTTLVP